MANTDFSNVKQVVSDLNGLINNLLLLLTDKEKTVVTKRFNLDNSKKHTLEEIGKDFSVTRERVRQIEKNALSKMKRNVFNTTLNDLHSFTKEKILENGSMMREESFIETLSTLLTEKTPFNENELHLALVLHDELNCVGNTINFHPYIRNNDLSDFTLKFASDKLINQLNKYGNIKKISKIHNDLKPVMDEIGFDLNRMRSLIDIDKRITFVEDDFVGLLEWRHIHPRTLRDKILYILRKEKQPLHFGEISEKISEAKFDRRNVNVQAVHNELIRHDQFVLIGRGIYALSEWGYESGTVSAVIEKILSEMAELSQEEIIEEVLKQRQVKKITIVLALKNGDKFERIGRKRYKLKK